MAEVKGVLITAIRAFLIQRYGKEAFEQTLASFDPAGAALIQKRFLDTSFYPYETMDALGSLARALGTTQRTSGHELGRHIAESIFTGPYKPLLAKSTEEMLDKIAWIKEFFYRDATNVLSAKIGSSSGVVVYRYTNGVRPNRGVCRSLNAFWGRVLELAGNRSVTASHPTCVAEGRDRCEFLYSW